MNSVNPVRRSGGSGYSRRRAPSKTFPRESIGASDVPGLARHAVQELDLVVVRLELLVVERPVGEGGAGRQRAGAVAAIVSLRCLKFHGIRRQLWHVQWIDVPPTAFIIRPGAIAGVEASAAVRRWVGTSSLTFARPSQLRMSLRISSAWKSRTEKRPPASSATTSRPACARGSTAVPPPAPRPMTTTSVPFLLVLIVASLPAALEQWVVRGRLVRRHDGDVELLLRGTEAELDAGETEQVPADEIRRCRRARGRRTCLAGSAPGRGRRTPATRPRTPERRSARARSGRRPAARARGRRAAPRSWRAR